VSPGNTAVEARVGNPWGRAARRAVARRTGKALARRLGYDLVKRHFYSPVPDVQSLPDDFWERRSPLSGLDVDPEAQLRFLERDLGPHVAEFTPPRGPGPTPGFYLDNGTYGPVDAEVLYALIRLHRPARVIEVGSGFSSLVIGAALEANRAAGSDADYEMIDPFPASASHEMGGVDALRSLGRLTEQDVTLVPLETFRALESGDVLFVDGTHTVKAGSDANRMILDVLPELRPGVIVHFHDIFLPYEYPREWLEGLEYYWAEQYLLQAFLAFNDAFEIVFAAHMLARELPDRLARTIPSTSTGASPAALWLRRRA
jgi:predicted O-methyltransferase YrrM